MFLFRSFYKFVIRFRNHPSCRLFLLTNSVKKWYNIMNYYIFLEKDMLKLLKLLGSYKKETVLAPTFKLLEAVFELFVPLVIASIIDVGIHEGKGYIIRMSLILVLLSFVGFAASVIAQYFSAKASVGFASKIRSVLFGKIQEMSYTELDRAGASSLITNMTSDINQIQTGTNLTLRLFMRSPCIVFGAMIMAFTINVRLALIFTGMIALLSVIVFAIMLGSVPFYKKVQASLGKVTGAVRENLTGARVLRGFCKEETEREAFNINTKALQKAQNFVGRISALMNPLTYLTVNGAIILLIYFGALRVDSGELTQGELVAMYNYMTQILVELVKLASLIITITKAVASGQRIQAVIDSVDGEKKEGICEFLTDKPKIEFNNVSFKYDGAGDYSLANISFEVKNGETVGIIGATGSGKTTLVNLIPALYLATEGEILVDGINVKDADPASLRRKFGIVPQRATLFRGELRDNLNWRKSDVSDEDIEDALITAQASKVVADKKCGLDAIVEQKGRNFSGGQRQRLTIARALVSNPEILILDDSSSALDYATDSTLRSAITDLPYDHTTIIVSQRTSSIMHANKILVLDEGRLIGMGTHDELYENCEAYREIHDLQFAENKGGNR